MRVKAALVGAMLFFGLNGVAHAVNMIAGPLSGDSCSCFIVNVSSSPKQVEIQGLDKGGNTANSLTKTLNPGAADGIPINSASVQYCKFVNASPTNFRATMQCSNGTTGFFALPAR